MPTLHVGNGDRKFQDPVVIISISWAIILNSGPQIDRGGVGEEMRGPNCAEDIW